MTAVERCTHTERSIDIKVIFEDKAPVALMVDGPSHFLHGGRPNGSMSLRNLILARTWLARGGG